MKRPIEQELRWTRFKGYAARVRSLGIVGGGRGGEEWAISHETYRTVLCLSEPFLPNLHTLYWNYYQLGPLQAYLFPKLSHLKLDLTEMDSTDFDSAFASMDNVNCSVKTITLVSDDLNERQQTSLSNFLIRFESLRCFESGRDVFLSAQTLAHLVSISSLRRLRLDIKDQGEAMAELCRHQGSQAFKNMEVLELRLSDIRSFMAFLDAIPLAPICKLGIVTHQKDDAVTIQRFFSLLRSRDFSSRLTSLKFLHLKKTRHRLADRMIPDVFRPLLSLRALKQLHVTTFHGYQLDDATLRDMSEAWPLLEVLELGYEGWRGQSRCTWMGLISLLNQCRNLQAVTIAICKCSLPNIPPGFVQHKSLEEIDFLDSPMAEDPYEVAILLSQLFLNLPRVQAWDMPMGGPSRRQSKWEPLWMDVQTHLKRLVEVRKYESRRTQAIH